MTITHKSTPMVDGFRMPAEWESHKGCWMTWPERTDVWYYGGKPAQENLTLVATEIAKYEQVTVVVSAGQYANARVMLPEHIRVIEMTTNDAWTRDMGATFVVNDETGEVRGVDWDFNAWGGLISGAYFPWDMDDAFAQKMCEIEGLDRYKAPFVLEGGSIHVDGEGTVITTEQCLLNNNRNPDLTREQIEGMLHDYLGTTKVIWLPMGWTADDDTDGHVDNLAMFVRPGVIALSWTDDTSDPIYPVCKAALEVLERSTDAKGRAFSVIKIPTPTLYYKPEELNGLDSPEVTYARTERVPASYVNCYIANDALIVPIFDCIDDELALARFREAFPDRKVVGVSARNLVCAGGDIHCLTQQVPQK